MVQITSDIELSGAGCTTAITPNQLVQSSSENDNQVQTYGRSAALAPITIVAENRAVGDILADIGYQTSARCDVVVAAERRLVEIRYRREFSPPAARPRRGAGRTG